MSDEIEIRTEIIKRILNKQEFITIKPLFDLYNEWKSTNC